MTSKQRAYLIGTASTYTPVVQIGKNCLTPEICEAVNEALAARELIKVSVLKNCADDTRTLAETLAERTRSTVVHVIGKKIVLYKPDKDKPSIKTYPIGGPGNQLIKANPDSINDIVNFIIN